MAEVKYIRANKDHDNPHHVGRASNVRAEQAADFELEDWQKYQSIGHLMWEYGLTEADIEAAGGCIDDAIELKIEGWL